MQLKDNKKIDSIRKYWFILLYYILIILVVFIITGKASWSFFVILSSLLTLFCSLFFWQFFILPEIGLSKHMIFSNYIILNQLFKTPLVLSVKNGEIKGDYVLLKKKPNTWVINIDQKSAVLIEDNNNQNSLLLHGIHVLRNNPKIIGSFYLGIHYIHIGPDDQNSLKPKNIQETLTEYHSRINLAQQTKTRLLSGDFIYPSFSVFYRLDKRSQYNNDLEMFLNLTKLFKGKISLLVTSRQFESCLVNEILNNWRKFCINKNREEILAGFSGKFEPTDIRIKGVKSQIYIDHIY